MYKKVIKKKKIGGYNKTNWAKVEPELIMLIADGMSQAKACEHVGIHPDTLIEHKKVCPEYSERLERAKGETSKLAHKSIKVGMLKDWKAGAWWLERTEPERFREQKQVDVKELPNLVLDDIFDENEK
jgi:hypothetical protein